MTKPRIYTISFASVYPLYVAKAEKKGRTAAEVDRIIRWLTGYSQEEFEVQLAKRTDFEPSFAEATAGHGGSGDARRRRVMQPPPRKLELPVRLWRSCAANLNNF